MIVVTTPTGQIGSQVVQKLLERDSDIRVIVRDPSRLDGDVRRRVEVIAGSHDDPSVLDAALSGADALFWLIPPNSSAPSAQEHYLSFARAGAAAVERRGVGRVVGVTSAGHGYPHQAGVLSAAFAMDEVLRSSGAAYRALSLPFYMENVLDQLSSLEEHGVLAMTCAPDLPLASIATRDIATVAADLLADPTWTGQEDLPLFGPDRLTPREMTAVLAEELDRHVSYQHLSMDDLRAMLRSHGAQEQTISDLTSMFAAQDGGIYDEDWKIARLGATDFRTWCREVLVPARRAL